MTIAAALLLSTLTQIAFAQAVSQPEGYYLGAFVRDGSVQIMEVDFYREADTLWAEMSIPDWVYYPPYRQPVERDEFGRFLFRTVYGKAELTFDAPYRELVGSVGQHNPPLRLHLKKNLKPPQPAIRTEDLSFAAADGTRLEGTIVLPDGPGPHPVIVWAHGRGCGRRGMTLERARLLSRYGVGGYVFDERGGGESEGDCASATFDDTVSDFIQAVQTIVDLPDVDSDRIGFWGGSAGGWVVIRAAVVSPVAPAFVVTVVGPATSVKEQQKDNIRYISLQRSLSDEARQQGLDYVDLMFADRDDKETQYEEMRGLIELGEESGWARPFLERGRHVTDVPTSPVAIDSLWVRRYAYDPAPDLRSITAPFLAIFGENDRVVPPQTNTPLLRRLLDEAGNSRYTIAVLPVVGHGMEHGHLLREVDGGPRRLDTFYWKFDRVTPDFMAAVVVFLRKHGLTNDS